ncbi:phosphoribosyl-ATP diphosphatase [Elioraea tepida]|jgi:phosphoribosyl-ATP pyrophosphohydrolase|uniref:Phosphoribosyl-ATP pyrophosphatase n=1 Tax=Elioraea tepida TaxID=2843330 RepID=A0A975U435_9PROT|nr:phosphoribosyl-ATP diphosphatase [Elioraea tepida]QXM26101.1 phosphoribosyl-ATP diphosphatase [Elioraea tepida]
MAKPPKKAGKKTEKKGAAKRAQAAAPRPAVPPPLPGPDGAILDRLWATVLSRRGADPELSHSARLLARGTAKVAQKFGEEAVEAVIEATRGNRSALIGESADVLYHLMVVWVDAGIRPEEVWAELERREAMSGIDEKASRARPLTLSAVARRLPPRGRSTKLW